jgi:hypothetical protein
MEPTAPAGVLKIVGFLTTAFSTSNAFPAGAAAHAHAVGQNNVIAL